MRFLDFLCQPVIEHMAIWQPGQHVKVCLFPYQVIGFFLFGDIAKKGAELVLASCLDRGNSQFDREFAAIAMLAHEFDPCIQYRPIACEQKVFQSCTCASRYWCGMMVSCNFAQQLHRRPSRNIFCLAVPADDETICIHLHYSIHGSLNGGVQTRFAFAQ